MEIPCGRSWCSIPEIGRGAVGFITIEARASCGWILGDEGNSDTATSQQRRRAHPLRTQNRKGRPPKRAYRFKGAPPADGFLGMKETPTQQQASSEEGPTLSEHKIERVGHPRGLIALSVRHPRARPCGKLFPALVADWYQTRSQPQFGTTFSLVLLYQQFTAAFPHLLSSFSSTSVLPFSRNVLLSSGYVFTIGLVVATGLHS